MSAKYYGGWSHEDDMQLVDLVLKNVRRGKGVIDGCKEYEELTNGKRSADASKYRFHTQLKAKYQKAYELARTEGKKVKSENSKRVTKTERLQKVVEGIEKDAIKELTIEDVLVVINQFKKQEEGKKVDESEMVILQKENAQLKYELEETQKLLEDSKQREKQIMEALKALEGIGINLKLPETKYAVQKDGTVELL